jgi:hypothetical protein
MKYVLAFALSLVVAGCNGSIFDANACHTLICPGNFATLPAAPASFVLPYAAMPSAEPTTDLQWHMYNFGNQTLTCFDLAPGITDCQ